MRFDQTVTFWSQLDRKYNPKTSQYEGEIKQVDKVTANITDVGLVKSVQTYGNYAQRGWTIRLKRPVTVIWSYLTIDDGETKYRLQNGRQPINATTLIVGEAD